MGHIVVPLKVYLFTHHFPFTEVSEIFLAEELRCAATLPNVELILIPFKRERSLSLSLPANVVVDTSIIKRVTAFRLWKLFFFLFRVTFWLFLIQVLWRYVLRFRRVPYILLARYLRAEYVADFVVNKVASGQENILYSYWLDEALAGFSLARRRRRELVCNLCISRAHGYDFRTPKTLFPFRSMSLRGVDRVVCASRYGVREVEAQYPELGGRCVFSPLGVQDLQKEGRRQEEGRGFQFVSCSNLVRLKRVGLIFDCVNAFARHHPNDLVFWTHFGDGVERVELERHIEGTQTSNLSVSLRGAQANAVVRDYLGGLGQAIMVNLSESEGGIPVSLQEALASGLPLVVSRVGGNPEAVDPQCGELLSGNPTPSEFLQAVERIWGRYPFYASNARKKYEECFLSERNFTLFYKELHLWSSEKRQLSL